MMAKVEDSFEESLEVSGPLRLDVRTGSGEIELVRSEDGKLSVSSSFKVRARSEQEAKELAGRIKLDPPVEFAGDLIRIGDLGKYGFGHWPFGPSVVFDFVIRAPAETEARLDSGSGDQEVRGLKGPIKTEAGSGDVEVADVEADVDVDTGSGDIRLGRVGGEAKVDAGSGDIELNQIAGRAKVDVGSGDVLLKEMGGDVEVEAGSGDIILESAIGANASWTLDTGSGDVRLLLPSHSQFSLRAKTNSGEFETDFPLVLSGKIGKSVEGKVGENPTAVVQIKTSSGDIRISIKE
jgi:hypothetical protein